MKKRIISILVVLAMLAGTVAGLATNVFAEDTYNKVTSADEITTGKYVLVADGHALGAYSSASSGWVLSTDLTVDGSVTDPAADLVWTVTVNGDGTVKLTDSNNVSIAPKSGNNNGILTGEYNWTFTFADGTGTFAGTGDSDTTILAYNKNEGKFRAYKKTTVTGNPASYPSEFTMYKLTEKAPEPPKVELPEGAIKIDCLGYNHTNGITVLIAGDNKTVGELTAAGTGTNGSAKDMNYFVLYVVGADGKVTAIHDKLGRTVEGGVKTDVVCPAGGYIIGVNGTLLKSDENPDGLVLPEVKVGDEVKLYNVDPAEARGMTGHKEVSGAGFTVQTPKVELPEGAIKIDCLGYNHTNGITVLIAGDNKTVGELTAAGTGTNGSAKDMNYFVLYVVGADGKVTAIHDKLGRTVEGGVKTDVVCPAGGYIIGVNGTLLKSDENPDGLVLPEVKVGDEVTLYNIDPAEARGMTGHKEVSDAGFTVTATPIPVQPETKTELPAGAIALNHAGYAHGNATGAVIMAGDGQTIGQITLRGVGVEKDPAWWVMLVVNSEGKVTSVLANGDSKKDIVCPEGSYIIGAWSSTPDAFNAVSEVVVGSTITLYNVNLAGVRELEGFVALESAGFTAKAPLQPETKVELPEGAIVLNHAGYPHGNSTGAVIMAGDGQTIGQITLRGVGAEKDPAWWVMLVVDSEGKVTSVLANGVSKKDIVCPEGSYIIGAWSSTPDAFNAVSAIPEGSTITLYNVNVDAVRTLEGYEALEGAGFAYEAPFVNLISGLDCGVTGYGKYNANLTDGVALNYISYNEGEWFALYYNAKTPDAAGTNAPGGVGTLLYDMGELCTVDKVRMNTFIGNASGITAPKSVVIEYSADGKTYNTFTTREFGVAASGDQTVEFLEFAGEATVKARYVKITVTLAGTFAFFNEIEVLGNKGAEPDPDPNMDYYDVRVSHVNAYSWGAFNAMIVNEVGKNAATAAGGYGCLYWRGIKVDNVDGTLTVTSIQESGTEKTDVVSEGGFILYVFSGDADYANAQAVKLGATVTADFDWHTNAASETPVGSLTFAQAKEVVPPEPPVEPDDPNAIVKVDGDLSDEEWGDVDWMTEGVWQSITDDKPQPAISTQYAVRADDKYVYVAVKVNRPWEYRDSTYQSGSTFFRIWVLGDGDYEEESKRQFFDVAFNADGGLDCYLAKVESNKIKAAADTSADTIAVEFRFAKETVNAEYALKMMVTYSSPYVAEEGKETQYNAFHMTTFKYGEDGKLPVGWSGNASMYSEYILKVKPLIVVDGDLSDDAWTDASWNTEGFWQGRAETDPQPEIETAYAVKADDEYVYVAVKVNRPWEYKDSTYQNGSTFFRIWVLGDGDYEEENKRQFFDVALNEDGGLDCYLAKTATDAIIAGADTTADTIVVEFRFAKATVNATEGLKMMVTYSSPYVAEEGKETQYNAFHMTTYKLGEDGKLPAGWSGNAVMYDEYVFNAPNPDDELVGKDNEDANYTVTVTAPETYVPGTTVKVTLGIKDVKVPMSMLLLNLHYDATKVEPIVKNDGDLNDGMLAFLTKAPEGWDDVICSLDEENGCYVLSFMNTDAAHEVADGEIEITIEFRVKEDATGDIKFWVPTSSVQGGCGMNADKVVGNGGITTLTYSEADVKYGDINHDGVYDSLDCVLLNRQILGLVNLEEIDPEGYAACDVNGDGVIDSIDYTLLKRICLGLITIEEARNS